MPVLRQCWQGVMTETELNGKLDEIDRLLNDPSVLLSASRVWSLLEEVAREEEPAF